MWCFTVVELLRSLTEAGVTVIGFSDDIIILANGADPFEKMQVALRIVERWCTKKGLSANHDKMECVLFTRKRVRIPTGELKMFGKILRLVNLVKYLGIVLNKKLYCKEHAEYANRKFLNGYCVNGRVKGSSIRGCTLRCLD